MKKNLTKIMDVAQKPISDIKKVKYFDDLTITAASHKHFPCAIQHRRTECQPDRFSLEMLLNGENARRTVPWEIVFRASCAPYQA